MKHLKNHGSLQNVILANSHAGVPEVGQRCTIALWTDRHVHDVVWVSDCKTKALIRECNVRLHPESQGGCGHQDWLIESNEKYPLATIKFQRGRWSYEREYTDSIGRLRKAYDCKLAIVFNCESYYYDWTF